VKACQKTSRSYIISPKKKLFPYVTVGPAFERDVLRGQDAVDLHILISAQRGYDLRPVRKRRRARAARREKALRKSDCRVKDDAPLSSRIGDKVNLVRVELGSERGDVARRSRVQVDGPNERAQLEVLCLLF
jgi:hypothetical protein